MDTPRTDAIWREIKLANHPETDGPHFYAFMETARQGVEQLERESATLAAALRDCVAVLSGADLNKSALTAALINARAALSKLRA